MVWLQANKFNVPRVAFINKMDRPGANLEFTLKTIKEKLNVTPLLLQIPLGESERFYGVIDLLKFEIIEWSDNMGCIVNKSPLLPNNKYFKEASENKEKLLESLSMLDDKIAVIYINMHISLYIYMILYR